MDVGWAKFFPNTLLVLPSFAYPSDFIAILVRQSLSCPEGVMLLYTFCNALSSLFPGPQAGSSYEKTIVDHPILICQQSLAVFVAVRQQMCNFLVHISSTCVPLSFRFRSIPCRCGWGQNEEEREFTLLIFGEKQSTD